MKLNKNGSGVTTIPKNETLIGLQHENCYLVGEWQALTNEILTDVCSHTHTLY